MNREQWLTEVSKAVEPLFTAHFKLPPYRVTCGWPCKGALARKAPRVGECHGIESSRGGVFEIFISPMLAEPLEVAGTVCHELAHVAAGVKAAHGKYFKAVCRHVGITKGRPTSAMPDERLNDKLRKIIEVQGEYPHKALVPVMTKIVKASSTVVLICKECECKVSMGRKWFDEVGPPVCACGGEFAGKGGAEEDE